ncbi:putative mediator of RNA polymerase II transcription subunit 4 [Podospora australis]|uniref:Mediator of RNA polymerase II transcription subunit 4 n=1 Tax=Podospora australis TaxID=1536484 RepID=A0AAN6WM72_9PEZI|nr:putative mediator of RNA polymerase II transcription subunit 4 [Podospora australis]
MDKKLDGSFERVERSLALLIDSLTKYNPSEKLAQELASAEQDLQQSLKELEVHQNNFARIDELRRQTEHFDAQTKEIVQALWNMRKELKAVTTMNYSSSTPKYDFTVAQLLAYARRISRNTLPPPGVTNGVDLTSSSTPGEAMTQDTPGLETGASTPAAAPTPGPGQTPSAPNDSFQQQSQSQPSRTGTDLPIHLKPAVNPLENQSFYPWPTVDQIRSGALARYQDLINQGIDPKNYDPEEEERKRLQEEEARREAEEKARQEREEQERRNREERERMARDMEARRQQQQEEERRRSSVAVAGMSGSGGGGSATSPSKPKQFTFLDDDDDEE